MLRITEYGQDFYARTWKRPGHTHACGCSCVCGLQSAFTWIPGLIMYMHKAGNPRTCKPHMHMHTYIRSVRFHEHVRQRIHVRAVRSPCTHPRTHMLTYVHAGCLHVHIKSYPCSVILNMEKRKERTRHPSDVLKFN